MLLRQATVIDEALSGDEPALVAEVLARVGFARSCLAALERPSAEFGSTCPDDGTPIHFDYSRGVYCCVQGHCPPGR
jgi:hypothetical protein